MATESRFQECLRLTLNFEGGFSDDPKDAGGATNMGITEGTLNSAYKAGIVSHNNIKSLTTNEAAKIYEINYWNKCRCYDIPEPLDYLVFDMAVNAGVGTSSKAFQNVLNRYSTSSISEDGAIGEKTIALLDELLDSASDIPSPPYKSDLLIRAMVDSLLQNFEKHYVSICEGNTQQQINNRSFLRGWMNRNVKRAAIAGS